MDVTSDESVRKAVNHVIKEVGRVDVVVANGGIPCHGPVLDIPTTPWSGLYSAIKAVAYAITKTLQMEAKVLSSNIHVVLVVPAGIKFNIADNSTFQLPETSLYKAYLPSIAARLRVSQQPGACMPATTFAKAVAQATLRKGGPPREFTYGAQTRLFTVLKWLPKGFVLWYLWRRMSQVKS
ncbi:unnamed protein product [Rhizoctonia solani]|uniref:NADPH-dependent 1-acyldihydroxyacetone phosphate reductase n=1 Tax=Rhizoctonia solani TaxID=456999 RepID=A0A8H2WGQ6_9AGAM|nr:unnamed protein product [Rhizoctonia solani]